MRNATILTAMMLASAVTMTAAPAVASGEIQTVDSVGDTRSEACAKAKQHAQDVWGKRVVRFGACECSDRGADQYNIRQRFHCHVDVYLRD